MKRLITLIVLIAMVLSIFAGCQSSGMDATQATEPSSEATEPSSEATEPSSEATEPSSEATEPSSEATEPSSEATEPSEPIDPDVLSLTPPSKEVLQELSDAFVNAGILNKLTNYPEDCGGFWIYGTINGCIVIFGAGNMFWSETITVADCEFFYASSFEIYVYRDGEVCVLKDAYEKGWLTEDHIKQLEARHPDVIVEMDKA